MVVVVRDEERSVVAVRASLRDVVEVVVSSIGACCSSAVDAAGVVSSWPRALARSLGVRLDRPERTWATACTPSANVPRSPRWIGS